ncbi:MAG: SDR family NAD(P)-dependent oxidoreductase, partial [Mucinivorans sp.]
MKNLFDLTGKVALVTGATHGLGMAMATALAEAGAVLVVNDLSREKLDHAIKEYASHGIKAHGYIFDVTNEEAVVQAVAQITKEV